MCEGPNTDVTVSLGYIAKNDGATNTLACCGKLERSSLDGAAQFAIGGAGIQEGSHGFVWTRG